MNIKFYTAGQGLMTIEINNKITDWSISNNKGKWQVYYKWTDYTFGKDLSRFIHDNKKLTQEVKKIIEQNYDKVIEQTR